MSQGPPSLRLALGALALLAAPSLAQNCWTPDAFDDFGVAPAPITAGAHTGLRLQLDPNRPEAAIDRYTIDLPAQSRLTLDVRATSPYAAPSPDSFVYTSVPVPPTFFSGSFAVVGNSSLGRGWRVNADGSPTPPENGWHLDSIFENRTNALQVIEFSVQATALTVFGCVEYSMDVAVTPRPCNVVADDALEGPDDCLTATTLAPGLWTDLIVFDASVLGGADMDYYRVPNVQPGESVAVTVLPHHAEPVAIGVQVTDQVQCDSGLPMILEHVIVNQSATPVDFYVNVQTWSGFHFQGSDRTGCESYDLHLARIPGECGSLASDALEPNSPCTQSVALAAGVYLGLTFDGSTDDYYEVSVPPQQRLRAIVNGSNTAAQVSIDGALAPSCPMVGGSDQIERTNHSAVAQTFGIRVASARSMCSAYDLELRVEPARCTVGYQADIDPGSSCAAAAAFPEGTRPFYDEPFLRAYLAYSDFAIEPGDEDYLRIQVRPHDTYVAFLEANVDALDFDAVVQGACGSTPTSSKRHVGFSHVRYLILPNVTDQHLEYVVRVSGTALHTQCEPYALGYYRGDPCEVQGDTPDAFDQTNTSCLTAPLVPAGSVGYQGLAQGSARFVRTVIPAGRTLTAELTLDSLYNLGSDVSLTLHDGTADCTASGASLGSVVCNPLATVNSIQFTNTSAQEREVLVEVRLADNVIDCGVVWLELALDDGAPYVTECLGLDATGLACPCGNQLPSHSGGGCVNSAGRSARLEATGTNGVAANDLLLSVSGLPSHRMGLVLAELVEFQPLPLGQLFYDGRLCLDPTDTTGVLRLQSSSQGAWQTFIPLAGLLGATAGRTHRIQVWYRDVDGPCGTGSNTTNAIRVDWQP